MASIPSIAHELPRYQYSVAKMTPLLVSLAGLVALALFLYNSLVTKKNAIENAFASIDVFLKRRYDLVPNLVAIVKRYAEHEAETLTRVTEMRSRARSSGATSAEQVDLDNQLTTRLGQMLVTVEAYPKLKADEGFRQLQRSLNETEEQLSAARRAFNAAVTDFNNAIEMFPGNLMASWMKYGRRAVLVTPDVERGNVNVQELLKR